MTKETLELESRMLRLKLENLEKALKLADELNAQLTINSDKADQVIQSLERQLGRYQGQDILRRIINQ